ncbi:MAG: hypothetical protein KGI75_15270, partial [Rhizobiaceae bacterium]|nr:hypothetical protein [Rhizobiaceae bacterium]
FITREEHADIVSFYKKVIMHQFCTIRDLRDQLAEREFGTSSIPPKPTPPLSSEDPYALYDNVVVLRPKTLR